MKNVITEFINSDKEREKIIGEKRKKHLTI